MWKKDAKANLTLFLKAGLPYTLGGMAIVFLGLYGLKRVFADNPYLTYILFAWLAVFWMVYQPLFKNKMITTRSKLKHR